ncbi:hypothetical protein JB92DRAFT_2981418 [Gautieria morchelliformis]|nr:hypothetical protein JB92DRAFT_2981418 [Gautieria morchelliformis]
MPSPPIQVFLTTIASQPSLRQRQEYILRILQVRKVTFTSYDLASDETAKKLWRRKAPPGKHELPGILVGGRFPGTFSEFEEAVEYNELSTFLRLNETWDEDVDGDRPAPPVQPVGVPGASSPAQMTNHKPSFAASPSPLKSKNKGQSEQEFDVGTELVGYGLQGVKVTDDELRELVEELGLDGADAGELVKGLGSGGNSEGVTETLGTEAKSLETEATTKQELVKESKDITQDKHH